MIAEQIQEVGPKHFVLGTDFGVYTLPPPVEGMREFIASMLDLEFGEEDVRAMTSVNPGKLLDLE
jgi:microsomal dipeptidase-like Zn-dependent dipeptidase